MSCYLCGHLVQTGQDAMHKAVVSGQLGVVKVLSPMFGARVHKKDSMGLSCLHLAAILGYCQVARYLIEKLKFDPKDKGAVCGVLEKVQHLCTC